MSKIHELSQGQRARLVGFGQSCSLYRRQLLSLGLTLKTEIKVLNIAPLGCPIHIEVRGIGIALRKDEAAHLDWEAV